MGADASQFADKTIILTNDHGKNLQCGGSTFGHSPNEAGWEHWRLEVADRDGSGRPTSYYVSCPAHDIRLSASDNKTDVSVSKNRAGWEKFRLEASGDRFFIISAHGTQIGQDGEGRLYQTPNRAGWEMWRIRLHGLPTLPYSPSGKHYLTNVGHGKQLSFSDNGSLSLSPNKAAWEQVAIEVAGDKVIFRGHHGHQLQVDDVKVKTSPNKAGWEQFTLRPAGAAGQYFVVAHTGKHVGCDGSNMYVNDNTGSWETWALTPA